MDLTWNFVSEISRRTIEYKTWVILYQFVLIWVRIGTISV